MCVQHHALVRYTQRFLGITDEKNAKKHVNNNRDKLECEVLNLKEQTKHIYQGAIGDNIPRNFYANNEICIVCGEKDDVPISLYKHDFGLTEKANKKVVECLLEEIEEVNQKKEEIKNKIQNELPKKQNDLFVLEQEINILQQQLKIKLKQKDNIENEIELMNKEIEVNDLEKQKIVAKLVGSIFYRMDFLNNTGNKTVA